MWGIHVCRFEGKGKTNQSTKSPVVYCVTHIPPQSLFTTQKVDKEEPIMAEVKEMGLRNTVSIFSPFPN
jgi:hypothetical protein